MKYEVERVVVEYEDWGGRGFNLVTADCGPSRGPACPEGGLGRSGWSHPVGGTEASWGRSSVRSTLVRPLRTQWLSPLCIL